MTYFPLISLALTPPVPIIPHRAAAAAVHVYICASCWCQNRMTKQFLCEKKRDRQEKGKEAENNSLAHNGESETAH